jgi:hypothetical protein
MHIDYFQITNMLVPVQTNYDQYYSNSAQGHVFPAQWPGYLCRPHVTYLPR